MPAPTRLLDETAMRQTLERMADEIVARCPDPGELLLVGIQRRGVELSERLAHLLAARHGAPPPLGKLDITLYRDDLQAIGPRPIVGETRLPPSLDGVTVVIVDDVLFTGRTIRAALDELADFGRPKRVLLAVLVDRGGRELPIQPDVTGLVVPTSPGDHVNVRVRELDGTDSVELVPAETQ
ncbi:MAG: bifunctional pyr operon transcriptional regulator/uracil phosphoribosyltransferase PyrR [Gemmatimonadales bacterium]